MQAVKNEISINSIKTGLIDNFVLLGAIFGIIVFLIPIVTYGTVPRNLDFVADIINLTALLILYIFRKKVLLQIKAGFIIITAFSFFATDLYQNGIGSTVKVILVLIPFLSIMVFSLKTTIIIFFICISTYAVIAYLHVSGIIYSTVPNPEYNTVVKWTNTGLLFTLVSLIIAMFVHYLNNSLIRIINFLEDNNLYLKKQDESLKESLAEKEVLLQEIHHRVKNNLAVVSGLLDLQSSRVKDPDIQRLLSVSTHRIQSISKVHEMLYQSEDMSKIDLKQYVQELSDTILKNLNKTERSVLLDLSIGVTPINLNHAVPIGIILNELITNSLKHGFEDTTTDGKISISAVNEAEFIHIHYHDNGCGIQDFEAQKPSGLGFTLIYSLLSQLEAIHTFETEDSFSLSFKFPAN